MNKQLVDKKLEKRLPQAGQYFEFSIYKFWFKQFYHWIIRKTNSYGYIAPMPKWYFSSRGANFRTFYFGPIVLTIKRRWLLMSARVLHPQVFK